MSLLWGYVAKHKKILSGALGLAVINQVFSLLDPQVFRLMIDNYALKAAEHSSGSFLQGIIFLLFLYIAFAFISRTAKAFQDYFVNVITQRVGAELYADSVAHSFSLPYAAFEDQRSGELLQKLQKAKTDNQNLIISTVGILFLSLVGVLFVVGYAFFVHWMIGVSYLMLFPVVGSIMYVLSRKIKEAQAKIVREQADLAGSTTETIRNVELVKSLGLEQQEVKRLNQVNENVLQLELAKVRLVRKLSFLQGTLLNFIRALIMLLLLWLIFQGVVSLGEFFTLFVYSFFVFGPLWELGTVITHYQEAKAANEQVEKILATKPESRPSHPFTVGKLTEIRFSDVTFSYSTSARPAVGGVSLTVKGGQTIAFVGPSGSGKTTLVKLLVGLYRPTRGSLLFNGTDAKTIDYDLLRRRIGLVTQGTQLFAGTIRENLLFVNPTATDADCLRVLEMAAAKPILQRGGRELDTKIGEGGLKLSGGERQRLAIARALLRNPDLIIFDEATSSLDSITEKEITKTIENITKFKSGLISVLIAHRLSTVARADRIYVLEKGKIVESGTHSQLLKKKGLYHALWMEQSAEGSNGKR